MIQEEHIESCFFFDRGYISKPVEVLKSEEVMEKLQKKILLESQTQLQACPDDAKLFDQILVEQDCLTQNWLLGDRLGAGIHGTSYRAYHRLDKKRVFPCAIKVMLFGDHPSQDQSSSFTEYVLEVNGHVNAYKALPEHVPRVYQAWSFHGKGYIAMDLIPDGALSCISSRQQFDRLAAIWNKLAEGGSLHGDFKSSNILYSRKAKKYYIADWGVPICPGDLRHPLIKPVIMRKIRKQLEHRRASRPESLFIPICEMMLKIFEKCDDLGQLVTRLVFYETLYRMKMCIVSPSLQNEVFAQINYDISLWLGSEFPDSEHLNNPIFWHYFHQFVDSIRNIIWLLQLELLERVLSKRYIRLAHDSGADLNIASVTVKYPVVQYLSYRTVSRAIQRFHT